MEVLKIISVVIGLLFSLSCSSQSALQKEINRLSYTLDNYEYCTYYSDIELSNISDLNKDFFNCNLSNQKEAYTNVIKSKVYDLIKKKYSEEELKKIAEHKLKLNFENQLKQIDQFIADTIGKNFSQRIIKNALKKRDSLSTVLKMDITRHPSYIALFNSIKTIKKPNGLMFKSMFLDKNNIIPVLKEGYKDTARYNTRTIQFLLAKLKEEPYYSQELDSLSFYIDKVFNNQDDPGKMKKLQDNVCFPRASFIFSDKSIKIYARLLDINFHESIDEEDVIIYSIPARAVAHLHSIINNKDFKKYFEDKLVPLDVNKKDIIWVKNWIINNEGSYELNKNFISKTPYK